MTVIVSPKPLQNTRTIVVQCERPDLGTRYVGFRLERDALIIAYFDALNNDMKKLELRERLAFSEYPEARLLHDGTGWNLTELACWLKYAATPETTSGG